MKPHGAESIPSDLWLRMGVSLIDELQFVVDALNAKRLFSLEVDFDHYDWKLRETPAILRKIVAAWQGTGPNLRKFARDWPTVWQDLQTYWKVTPMELSFGRSGGGAVIFHPITVQFGRTPYEEALRFFLLLIANPKWDKLAGPCARCANYYIRPSARNKVYCSRSCGTTATALAATKKRRSEERSQKLRRVEELCKEWLSSRSNRGWEEWVCRRGEITPRFLTRAVNRGDLKAPLRTQSREKIAMALYLPRARARTKKCMTESGNSSRKDKN